MPSCVICTWAFVVKLMHFRSWWICLVELVMARKSGCSGGMDAMVDAMMEEDIRFFFFSFSFFL